MVDRILQFFILLSFNSAWAKRGVAVPKKTYRSFDPSLAKHIEGFSSLWEDDGLSQLLNQTGDTAKYLRFDQDSKQIYLRDPGRPLRLGGMRYWVRESSFIDPRNLSDLACTYSISVNNREFFRGVPAQKLMEEDSETTRLDPYLWMDNTTIVSNFWFLCKADKYSACCQMECCNPMPWWTWLLIAGGCIVVLAGFGGILKWIQYNKRKDLEEKLAAKNGIPLPPAPVT